MVGDHHRVNLLFGIWFKPDLWAFVSFFHFMDSSKPLAFSLERANNQFYKISLISTDCHVPHKIEAGNRHTRSGEDWFMQRNFHGFACWSSVTAQSQVPSQLNYAACSMTEKWKRLNRISTAWAKDSSWCTTKLQFGRQGHIKVSLTRRDPPTWGSKCPWKECAPGSLPLHQEPGSYLCGSCSGSRVSHHGADVSTRTGSVSGPGDNSTLVSSFVFRSFNLAALIVGTKMIMTTMSANR